MIKRNKEKTLEDAIIDLYISIKIEEKSDKYDERAILSDREKLRKIDSLLIIEYIKTSIEILVNIKVKKQVEEFMLEINSKNLCPNSFREYEEMLRKAESDVRNHIRVELQLLLQNENLKQKIEELKKCKTELKHNFTTLQELLNKTKLSEGDLSEKKEKEIKFLVNELDNMKLILKSYEGQNSKIAELEMKLRNINLHHEKEKKSIEDKNKEEVNYLNKIILHYEDLKATNLINKTYQNKQLDNNVSLIKGRDNTLKHSNFIEEEVEINNINYKNKTKSRSPSPITEPKYQNERLNDRLNSNILQDKINSIKKLVENNEEEIHKHNKNFIKKQLLKSRRTHSSEYNEDFINNLLLPSDKKNEFSASSQNMSLPINNMNVANTHNNSKISEMNPDRSSCSKMSTNQTNGLQHFYYNEKTNNYNHKNDCSFHNIKYTTFIKENDSINSNVGDLKLQKQNSAYNKEISIKNYIYSKIDKSNSNSKLQFNNMNVPPTHLRSKSGYTVKY